MNNPPIDRTLQLEAILREARKELVNMQHESNLIVELISTLTTSDETRALIPAAKTSINERTALIQRIDSLIDTKVAE